MVRCTHLYCKQGQVRAAARSCLHLSSRWCISRLLLVLRSALGQRLCANKGAAHAVGVITKAAIQCAPRFPHEATCLLAVPSFQAVQDAHQVAKRVMSQALTAFEFFDEASLRLALQHLPGTRNPFDDVHPMYILIELAGVHRLFSPCKCASLRHEMCQAFLSSLHCRAQHGCVQAPKRSSFKTHCTSLLKR